MAPLCLLAQEPTELTYVKGDTLYYDVDHNIVAPDKAALFAVVKSVDEQENVASILIFDKNSNRLLEQRRIVASGENAGLKKGKQLYFNELGRVNEMRIFVLVHNPETGKTHSWLMSETLLYPDGKVQEEVVFTYPEKALVEDNKMYTRKGYNPDGTLQFEEHFDKTALITYYDENGQVTQHPAQKVEPYMVNPEFPGGQQELFYFLAQSVQYPYECQKRGIQGRVICQFVVTKNGKIEDVHVVRSGGHPLLDREAVRVLKSMPKWKPGKQRGKPVRVQYTVPVNFRLQ